MTVPLPCRRGVDNGKERLYCRRWSHCQVGLRANSDERMGRSPRPSSSADQPRSTRKNTSARVLNLFCPTQRVSSVKSPIPHDVIAPLSITHCWMLSERGPANVDLPMPSGPLSTMIMRDPSLRTSLVRAR